MIIMIVTPFYVRFLFEYSIRDERKENVKYTVRTGGLLVQHWYKAVMVQNTKEAEQIVRGEENGLMVKERTRGSGGEVGLRWMKEFE